MSIRWLWCAIGIVLIAGVLFRVEHIERRVFWTDETWTALRLSGHSYADVRAIFDGRIHTAADILGLQRVSPQRGVAATVAGLATEEPQHPPLFYVLERGWASLFGSSIPALRSLALICGLLAIAAVGWFGFELTGSGVVAGLAAALIAVSPFFVDYSGQAREYSLWAAMIAVTSALLLRALSKPHPSSWIWYAVAVTLALYVDVLMGFVLVAHALYVGARYWRERRVVGAFIVSAGAASVLFAPWFWICLAAHGRMASSNAWMFTPYPGRIVLEKWIFNTGSVLFDAEYANMRLVPLAGLMLLVVLAAVFALMRGPAFPQNWLLVALGAAIAVPQIAIDIAAHGHESSIARYMIPLWLSLLIAVALFFGSRLRTSTGALHAGWFGGLCAVLAIATFSCAINSRAVGWWDNNDDYPWTRMAAQVDSSRDPLVLSEGHWADVLVMSHYVSPQTRFLLFKGLPPRDVHATHDSFVLTPSDRTIDDLLQRGFHLAPVRVNSYTQASAEVARFHETLGPAASNHAPDILQHAPMLRFVGRVANR